MNLFASSPDPRISAQWLDSKRVNKMITETAQIICTVLRSDGIKDLPFKSTHEHHPIVKWAAESEANLNWTAWHHIALHEEWEYRFNKSHASAMPASVMKHIRNVKAPTTFQNSARNESKGLDFTWCTDPHLAYRLYLTARWMGDTLIPTWHKRKMPVWFDAIPDLLYDRAKQLIGKQKDSIINCPRCGNKLEYKSSKNFRCQGNHPWYPCLELKSVML